MFQENWRASSRSQKAPCLRAWARGCGAAASLRTSVLSDHVLSHRAVSAAGACCSHVGTYHQFLRVGHLHGQEQEVLQVAAEQLLPFVPREPSQEVAQRRLLEDLQQLFGCSCGGDHRVSGGEDANPLPGLADAQPRSPGRCSLDTPSGSGSAGWPPRAAGGPILRSRLDTAAGFQGSNGH